MPLDALALVKLLNGIAIFLKTIQNPQLAHQNKKQYKKLNIAGKINNQIQLLLLIPQNNHMW
jgi:hypothetical protein